MILSFIVAFILATGGYSSGPDIDKAVQLYDKGLYSQAMDLLSALPEYGSDPIVDGYAALCACRMGSNGYETMTLAYLNRHPSCHLCDLLRIERAFDLFDKNDYPGAVDMFDKVSPKAIPDAVRAEFYFKHGYSLFKCGNEGLAASKLEVVDRMVSNDHSAPSRYVLGYMSYMQSDFDKALEYFEKTLCDERFVQISGYYIISCHFEKDDYEYVVSRGVTMLEDPRTPPDRKAHLARIVAESYLLQGDKEKALEYWSLSDDGSEKFRADFFFAGSLMYTTGDWQGAIDNYSKVVQQRDSLSQIAYYQMAFSYLETKNRVNALESFRNATELSYDPKMTEDAFFNYAKLAFDLNGDTSVFKRYMDTYRTRVRGEKIYSYMALASLHNRDYQAAIDFYDNIDVLEGQDRSNYVNANFLRGAELMEGGSYRKASEFLKAVTYYSGKDEGVNQLARYSLAEAFYKDGDYAQAFATFTELYNASALYGMNQGEMLSYNAAWSALKMQNYSQAVKWFDIYASSSREPFYYKDALLRKADCQFALADYSGAAASYAFVMDNIKDSTDIYPRYQCAVATGLITNPANKTRAQIQRQKQLNLKEKLKILAPIENASPFSPYWAEAMFEYGKTLLSDNSQTPAVRTFLLLADKSPKNPYAAKALLEVGTIRRGNKNIEGAVECYKRVVEQMDSLGYTDDALMALESIYQSENAPEKYIAYLESTGRGNIKSESDKQSMVFDAALQIFYSGNFQRAVTSFRKFQEDYASSDKVADCHFFIGECLRKSSDKVRACDSYRKAVDMGKSCSYRIDAVKGLAQLSYELENFDEAYFYYHMLLEESPLQDVKSQSRIGMMRSSYKAKKYSQAVGAGEEVLGDDSNGGDIRREASMILAKSHLALSNRDRAIEIMTQLSKEPTTREGAEAAYFIIQDCFDRADYGAVQTKVYAFAESGTKYQYYLAKSFIVLGDSFAEQGNLKQAKATFQSIADGYSGKDEVSSEIRLRLDKLMDVK